MIKKIFYFRVDPGLVGKKELMEYGFFLLSIGKRPKNCVVTKNVKTVRFKLSYKGDVLLKNLLKTHEDIKTRQQACRMALSIINESPKHIKAVKKIIL